MSAPGSAVAPAALELAACEAARRAAEPLRRWFRKTSGMRRSSKGWHDFVTDADLEAEEAVVGYLRGRFPDHDIVTEESGDLRAGRERVPGSPRMRWILDPLDGTTNFIHGVAAFAVALAVADAQGLLAAAIHDPVHGETFHAHRGGGARLDGQSIGCSPAERLEGTLVATGIPFRDLSRLPGYLRAFEAFVRGGAKLRRAGAASLDLASTACGRYDGFWEIGLSPWDVAAGALLVREAGGVVTDVAGGDAFLESGDIVAAAPGLHAAMLGITRASL